MHTEQLELIFKDDYFVAINKPPGLLVHRSPIDKKETRFAVQLVRDQIGMFVFPVHRLDKPTSGVLIFALSSEMAKTTSDLFITNQIHKKYVAVVRGYTEPEGVIDHPLKDVKDKIMKFSTKRAVTEKEAITNYKRLATVEIPYMVDKYPASRYSLVELIPGTGKRHQLRRHMKHISHPIIGDTEYGKRKHNHYFKESFNCHRLLLAAIELRFIHPVTKTEITIKAALDKDFCNILKEFKWQNGSTD